MQRKPFPKLVLFIPLGLVVALLVAWQALAFFMRGPLAGEYKHDFGSITLPPGGSTELNHTFHLTNRTSKSLTINTARADCGCVSVNATFPVTLEPGAALDLPVVMRFGVRDKNVLIQLDCGEAGVQNLWVSARLGRNGG